MTVLVIGSIALDSLETPFGTAENVLGGAGSYFSLAASTLTPVQLVGVVGSDLEERHLDTLRGHGVDLQGLQRVENGKTFRWKGRYEYDMNVAHKLDKQSPCTWPTSPRACSATCSTRCAIQSSLGSTR